MRPTSRDRIRSFGFATVTAGAVSFGFAGLGHGAALVSQTRQVEVSARAASGTDALKPLYRRPATIPFPKDNPYTPEKAALGKKLYFDTRLSVTSAQSCGSCHSPSFGWGDGLAVGVGQGMQKLGRHSPTVINAAWSDIFDEVIHQQGRAFSAESITIKRGEALTFLNDDTVPHNIMSATKGNEFNLGSQAPGSSTDVSFNEVGEDPQTQRGRPHRIADHPRPRQARQ